MVLMGIGFETAKLIRITWGDNALEARAKPETTLLSNFAKVVKKNGGALLNYYEES